MKNINQNILWLLGIVVVFTLIKSCDYFFDFEQKIYHYSKDLNQSKENNVFVSKIEFGSLKFKSEQAPLKIIKFNGWLEKTSTYKGNTIKQINENSLSIIFDLEVDEKFELNNENYSETWAIYYHKNYSITGFVSNSSLRGCFEINKDSLQKPIELKIQKFPSKSHPNDSKNIGSLILKEEK